MGSDGYSWTINASGSEWVWTIYSPGQGSCLLSGTAESRPHAAACVVRALIEGVVSTHQQPMAA